MPIPQIMPSQRLEAGDTVITNGTFASDTGWTKGDGWTISDGTASCDGSQAANSFLVNDNAVTAGKRYRTEFTVSGFSTGTIRVRLGGVSGATRGGNGTFVEIVTAGTTQMDMRANSAFVGSIDNVKVEPIIYT